LYESYLALVILLFVLAVSDLVVGVSNDAVNFLNSAIGSKVASRNVIMIVASLGIILGATFSSGMMEIARKGIFNPEYFSFSEVMIVFAAVMLTDIILLDSFNTFGLPTSTTVSIVFELLGAAVVISFIKVQQAEAGSLFEYINTSKATAIIAGIFLSIGVAFTVGAIVQYISRVIFSFHYEKRMPWAGSWWSGFAITAIAYFLLIKGMEGASFVNKPTMDWINRNTVWILVSSFVGFTLIAQLLITYTKFNILRAVVLFGTFSLAMAFAGNDLVNFIGVPIAGFESFQHWSGSGVSPESYEMDVLTNPVRTETYLLIIAGLIMVVTLWFSKKAQSVTDTEVNLGRQSEGAERFQPNDVSRSIVRTAWGLGSGLVTLLPDKWIEMLEKNFKGQEEVVESSAADAPAFDLVRASANLTMASILIAIATSLKLPLSTTYVSFMVAMGTSLADRAWGRDSAVYRVAGVLSVIGGWFSTALIAFTVSGIFASIIYFGGLIAVWIILGLVVIILFRSFIYHRDMEKQKLTITQHDQLTRNEIIDNARRKVVGLLGKVAKIYEAAVSGLIDGDRKQLKEASRDLEKLKSANEQLKFNLFQVISKTVEEDTTGSKLYLNLYDLEQDTIQSIRLIVDACKNHVSNLHVPLTDHQKKSLRIVITQIKSLSSTTEQVIHDHKKDLSGNNLTADKLKTQLEKMLDEQILHIRKGLSGTKISNLYISIILETIDLLSSISKYPELFLKNKRSPKEKPLATH